MRDSATTRARAAMKAGQPEQALDELANALRRHELDAAERERAGRLILRIAKKSDAKRLRVLILGQCTTSWLVPHLAAACTAVELDIVATDGDYDSVLQDLARTEAGQFDVVVLVPWTQRLLAPGDRSADDRIQDELVYWAAAWKLVSEQLQSRIVQLGYDYVGAGPDGRSLSATSGSVRLIRDMSDALRDARPAGSFWLDMAQVAGDVGRRQFYSPRQYQWTKNPLSPEGSAALCDAIASGIRALTTGPRKVLVLDLDNTLWGGVVGELGPNGVGLGDDPAGRAFVAFQKHCKRLGDRGVLLAVCSKNNDADAREPFEQNEHMVLKLDDFAAFEASWQPKAAAIASMAAELRLGTDSFVFFDDNPAEREQVRQALPEVGVVEVPKEPSEYVRALEGAGWFEAVGVTAADKKRSDQYRAERKRRDVRKELPSLDAYFESLQMVATVEPIGGDNLARVVQLVGKTNQFNLTTRRHVLERVVAMTQDPRGVSMAVRVTDRFGDHGLVAVLIAVPDDDGALRVDTWLMSCRVIARGVEDFCFAMTLQGAAKLGYERIRGEYIPSAKNAQVAELYVRLGLTEEDAGADGLRRFAGAISDVPAPKHYLKLAD